MLASKKHNGRKSLLSALKSIGIMGFNMKYLPPKIGICQRKPMLVKCDFGGQFTNIFTNIGGLNMPRYATLWHNGKNRENPQTH